MPKYVYRGLTTRKLYTYASPQAPVETVVTLNGEPCIYVNNDGSIMRGFAGATPPGVSQIAGPPGTNDAYDTYAATSKWEQS